VRTDDRHFLFSVISALAVTCNASAVYDYRNHIPRLKRMRSSNDKRWNQPHICMSVDNVITFSRPTIS
jgi:hypothetical protein